MVYPKYVCMVWKHDLACSFSHWFSDHLNYKNTNWNRDGSLNTRVVLAYFGHQQVRTPACFSPQLCFLGSPKGSNACLHLPHFGSFCWSELCMLNTCADICSTGCTFDTTNTAPPLLDKKTRPLRAPNPKHSQAGSNRVSVGSLLPLLRAFVYHELKYSRRNLGSGSTWRLESWTKSTRRLWLP